jgi:hypothetical protein
MIHKIFEEEQSSPRWDVSFRRHASTEAVKLPPVERSVPRTPRTASCPVAPEVPPHP